MSISKSFAAAGASADFVLRPGQTASYDVAGTFTGRVTLERSVSGAPGWHAVNPVATAVSAGTSGLLSNDTNSDERYRFRATAIDGETPWDGTAVARITDRNDALSVLRRPDGSVVARITDSGVEIPGLLSSVEEVLSNGDDAVAVSLETYKSLVITSGSQGAEELTIGDGTGVEIGTRKLIVLHQRTHASDSVVLDDENLSQAADEITAVELDAAGEFILLEWQGASWEVIKASAGVVTAS
jgi:hypothetical protein